MELMVVLLLGLAGVAVVELFGVDSRDGFADPAGRRLDTRIR